MNEQILSYNDEIRTLLKRINEKTSKLISKSMEDEDNPEKLISNISEELCLMNIDFHRLINIYNEACEYQNYNPNW